MCQRDRARLLYFALLGLETHCQGCCPDQGDFDAILYFTEDLDYKVKEIVQQAQGA
ncbi:MAG TPA: hypothetical protein VLM91_21635 [Candidatus Methylomirabilis sp.]|nr:hypothetical protein [Candidatus Methylomirabilis sp.]